ncbi:hypothetical protein DFH06DRAFT_1304778 [Mycena polygramma]|nr:hypothetical protein DFH06DRAFT_1304778 [Mycena polygramma]
MSTHLDLAGLAALTVTYSSAYDPRRLEYFLYGPLVKVAQTTVPDGSGNIYIACQHPVWSTPLSLEQALEQRWNPDWSHATQPDGSARGVLVDVATVFVTLKVHRYSDIPSDYEGQTLADLLRDVIQRKIELPPRFFAVNSLLTTSLWEAKHGPTRHPKHLMGFATNLAKIVGQARAQCFDQGMYLFTSEHYGNQDTAYLVAVVGEFLSFRLFTRDIAIRAFNGWRKRAKWMTSVKLPAAPPAALDVVFGSEEEEEEEEEEDVHVVDRVGPKGKLEKPIIEARPVVDQKANPDDGILNPAVAKATKKENDKIRAKAAADERAEWAAARKRDRDERYLQILRKREEAPAHQILSQTKPNTVRNDHMFSDQELNTFWKGHTRSDEPGTEPTGPTVLMETRTAQEFFAEDFLEVEADAASATGWSGLMRINTALANEYLGEIRKFNQRLEDEEEERRRGVKF